jgi:nucleoside phosphorylase
MSQRSTTLVCFAVKEEARGFQRLSGEGASIRILLTGIGKRNAEKAIRASIASERPGLVISSGFAGGLKPELTTGAVLYSTDVAPNLAAALSAAGAQRATFHCAERVATTPEQKRALREATGADAVEMESQILCSVCRENQIPAAIVRVVLDTANESLPLNFNELMTPDERLDNVKLSLAILKSPTKIPALKRLQKQSQFAAERLAEVLSRVLLDASG